MAAHHHRVVAELVGKVRGTGAKAIAEVRGNMLLVSYGEWLMEFNAGSKAAALAKKINIG